MLICSSKNDVQRLAYKIHSVVAGVSSIDLFNRPAANLFISISVPEGAKFTLKKVSNRF